MSSSDTTKMTQDSKKHGGGSHRNQLPPMSTTSVDGQPPSSGPNDIEHLKNELDREKKNRFVIRSPHSFVYKLIDFISRYRNQIQGEYADLKRQMEEFTVSVEEAKKNPVSKYDPLIAKQSYFNDTLSKQV